MIIKHKKIPVDLIKGKKTLDIGCGRKKQPGSIGLDHIKLPGVNVVADLNGKLPFKDEQFEVVCADQVLEHVKDLIGLVYEVHRVLRPGGVFLVHCPYFRSNWAHIDPTHVRSFTINSMDYFVKGTFCYNDYRFREEGFNEIEIFLDTDYKSTITRSFFSSRALSDPMNYENSFWSGFYLFEQISYLLRK